MNYYDLDLKIWKISICEILTEMPGRYVTHRQSIRCLTSVKVAEMPCIYLKHLFTMLISRPTGSGKTYFIRNMIHKAAHICDPTPKSITYLYGEYQKIFNSMSDVKFVEGLQEEVVNRLGGDEPEWLVVDDLMQEASNQTFVSNLFTKGSHHRNISVILITQNFFMKGEDSRNISLNSQYVVCFKNPREKSMITNIGRQMFPKK